MALDQLDMFEPPKKPRKRIHREPPRARNSDPGTSHAAADGIAPKVNRLQGLILDYLQKRRLSGATTGEMSLALDIPRDTLSPRMRTMEDMNLVMETEERRAVPGGRNQIVWRAK